MPFSFSGTESKLDNDLFELEVSNGTAIWTSLSDMFLANFPAPRANHGFVSAGGNLLVLGGAVLEGLFLTFNSVMKWCCCTAAKDQI